MGLSWILYSNKPINYEIKEMDTYWLNEFPWYNTTICYKLHVTVLEDFIRNTRTYRYNLMCSITAHDRQQHTYVHDTIISGFRDRGQLKMSPSISFSGT